MHEPQAELSLPWLLPLDAPLNVNRFTPLFMALTPGSFNSKEYEPANGEEKLNTARYY